MNVISPADAMKRARILEGATRVFLTYGFQRTTMDDIARAAEISRPALYLLFRNKTDIYRALAGNMVSETLEETRDLLARDLPLADKLEGALSCALDKTAFIEESPHGAEILDMKHSLARDIIAAARAELADMMEATIAEATARRRADLAAQGLSPRLLVDMLLDAVDGMKLRNPDRPAQRSLARGFINVIVQSVEGG